MSVVVALASGAIALAAAHWLPGTWYVIVAGVLGSALGLALERRSGEGERHA
jgi:predicted branched-subunit amino acid permease